MLKKVLILGGIAGIGFSFYYYFKRQLDLALDFAYSIKTIRILELTDQTAVIKTEIEITNKSSFNLSIEDYDIQFSYKNIPVARTIFTKPIFIVSDQTFSLEAEGSIDLDKAKDAIWPFIQDVIKKRPINLVLNGFVVVKFMNIRYKVNLDGDVVTYSTNLLADFGLEDNYDNFKKKLTESLGKIGIKI